MKLNILETHDRLLHFKKDQQPIISQGLDDCLKRNPLSISYQDRSPYVYIFGHPRTSDDGFRKRFLWQPRLTKPKAQTNSYLFRAKSHTDILEVCWMIPPQETWNQYTEGKVTENDLVIWSIDMFIHHKDKLEQPFEDDLPDHKVKKILIEVALETGSQKAHEKLMKNLYGDLSDASGGNSEFLLP